MKIRSAILPLREDVSAYREGGRSPASTEGDASFWMAICSQESSSRSGCRNPTRARTFWASDGNGRVELVVESCGWPNPKNISGATYVGFSRRASAVALSLGLKLFRFRGALSSRMVLIGLLVRYDTEDEFRDNWIETRI